MLATDTLVMIRLHKKANSLETKINSMKDRKVCADKNAVIWEEWMPKIPWFRWLFHCYGQEGI